MRILVIRNDKIGDFMLAWPAFAMLKASFSCHIAALVPLYTKQLAELCPYIDEVIVDCGADGCKQEQKALLEKLKESKFDASICYYSTLRNAQLVRKANIPNRWAPATKLFQFLYNHRLVQRRSQSAKAESEYNEDLSRAFLESINVAPQHVVGPYLRFPKEELEAFKIEQSQRLSIDSQKNWLIVHAGSGGSASNLTVKQFAAITEQLMDNIPNSELLLTVGPEDTEQVKALQQLLDGKGTVATGFNLIELCQLIACAQLFMSGSTGPLHIAGVLDTPTVGFYSNRLSAIGRRWRPANTAGRHLGFQSEDPSRDAPQLVVEANEVADTIIDWWKNL